MKVLTIETEDYKAKFKYGEKINISDLDSIEEDAGQIIGIIIAPNASKDYYEKIKKFLNKCNDSIEISNEGGPVGYTGDCSKEEFFKSEEIIDSIIKKIDDNWTDKQKIAFVHSQMGKLISYYPDFEMVYENVNTPEGNDFRNKIGNECRNIWKQICTKKGVCNGIVSINMTILSRIGIKAIPLSTGSHVFMEAMTEEGNIITDPTWDLEYSLYDLRPQYFGLSYEELLQKDGDITRAHHLTKEPENVKIISDKELRQIYSSIGIANKDGMFGEKFIGEINKINNMSFDDDYEKYKYSLEQFQTQFKDKLCNLSENRTILQIFLKNVGMDLDKISVDFVYEKSDEICKNPILSLIYEDSKGIGHASTLNQDSKTFENLKVEEFDEKYKKHICDSGPIIWKKYIEKNKENTQKQSIIEDREE